MKPIWYRFTLIFVASSGSLNAAAGSAVTFESLLNEMADLSRLTHMPAPAYTTRQFSSYDRRSTDPGVTTDGNWFANKDRGHFLRTETNAGREEFVMMDADGPGAIVRFWSANPDDAGTVRIYLDNADAPASEMPLTELLGGKIALAPEPVGGERARGWNSYLPIPYAEHCRVTADKPAFFYIIDYRTYAPGTEVATFSREIADAASPAIQVVAKALANPADIPLAPGGRLEKRPYSLELEPGDSGTFESPDGPGVLLKLVARVGAADLDAALRGCLLEVFADGRPGALVQAPLGDFFATVPGPNPYLSLPSGVLADATMYSRWPMPYRKGLAFRVANHTDADVTVSGELVADLHAIDRDTLYFHAKWRSERDIPTHPRRDWNFVTVQGQGRYVGTMLHVTNPIKNWWGEGDEKIYVDGETFPSWFGTGSEDYFGYAWCNNLRFTHAYHNQVYCDGPWNFGQTCVSRFHVMDDIPFEKSIQFDMEVWRGIDVVASQSAVSYWYATPDSTDNMPAPEVSQLTVPAAPPVPAMHQVAGAIEGEAMKLAGRTGGRVLRQYSDQWDWSGGAHRWWIQGAVGDRIDLAFDVNEPGAYDVRAAFTSAPDFGVVQVLINGEEAGPPRDFYADTLTIGPEETLGKIALKKGENTISAIIRGTNSKAVPARMFGLDYVRLVKE